MGPYLRRVPRLLRLPIEVPVIRVLVASAVVGFVAACGGRPEIPPAPSDPAATLAEFMSAVKRSDLEAMGRLWGTAQGPAAGSIGRDELRKRLETMRIYLAHASYRVLGTVQPTGPGTRQAYRIELVRSNRCVVLFPIELVRTRGGEWLVVNVNLDQVGNPARPCEQAWGEPAHGHRRSAIR